MDHKFSKSDKPFLEARTKFFEKHNHLGVKFAVDQWGLFTGQAALAKILARYEIIQMTLDIPGHILEFGVHHGQGLHIMSKILNLLSPHSYKKIYGFDSFEGLQNFSKEDGSAIDLKGDYKGDQPLLIESLKLHGLDQMVELLAGNIEQTLPKFLESNGHHVYSLVNLDVDVYPATKVILKNIWPQLAVGGIVVLDEGYDDIFPGEGKALQEFLTTIKGEYTCGHIPFAREPMMFIQKI